MHRPGAMALSLLVVACPLIVVSSAEGQRQVVRWIQTGDEEWDRAFKERLERMNDLAEKGKYRDVLKEAAWLLDNRPRSFPEFENNPTKMIVDYLYRLRRRYDRAGKMLERRRTAIEEAFLAGKGSFGKGHELNTINECLGDWWRTLELYDKLADEGKKGKRMQRELFLYVEESLLEEERFEELLTGAGRGPGNLSARTRKLKLYTEAVRGVSQEDTDKAKMTLCRSAARYYQAMLATGKSEEAARLAEEFLKYHAKSKTYVLFIRHAVNAKKRKTARRLLEQGEQALSKLQFQKLEEEAKPLLKKKKKKKKDPDD